MGLPPGIGYSKFFYLLQWFTGLLSMSERTEEAKWPSTFQLGHVLFSQILEVSPSSLY